MSEKKHHLERRLGLFQTTLAGIGVIVGAGIFVIIGLVAGHSGPSLWMSFILAALAAIFTGLSYAELSSMMPKDSGEFSFAKKAFGPFAGFVVLTMVILMSIFAATSVSVGFAGYFVSITGISNMIFIAAAVIILFSIFNWHGIRDSTFINAIFTIASVCALLFIIILGIFKGNAVNYTVMPFGLAGIFKGASLVFFAYLGFEGIIRLSEETKNPTKTIPKAILLSIIISTIIYIGVALSAVSLIDWSVLAQSSAPLADVVSSVFGSAGFMVIAFIALFATANTVLLTLLFASRGLYGLGEEFKKLKFFTRIGRFDTPSLAIFVSTSLALLFLLFKNLEVVAELTNFFIFLAFLIVNLSLIVLRYKYPSAKRPFKIPFRIGKLPLFPVLGIITIIVLFFNIEMKVLLLGILFTVLLIPIYWFIK